MEHVVFFPAHDGTPAFRRVAALDDAIRLVEHLRNVEGINEVSVHALAEVPLAFRTVIKVEVPGAADGAAQVVPAQPAVEPVPLVQAPVLVEAPLLVEAAPQEATPEAAAEESAADEVPVAEEPVAALPEPALAASNGRSGDDAKSLGFFS